MCLISLLSSHFYLSSVHLRLSSSISVSLCLSPSVCLRVMLCVEVVCVEVCRGVLRCVEVCCWLLDVGCWLLLCGIVWYCVCVWCAVCRSQHTSMCRFKTSPCVPATRGTFLNRHTEACWDLHTGVRDSERVERGRGEEQGKIEKTKLEKGNGSPLAPEVHRK